MLNVCESLLGDDRNVPVISDEFVNRLSHNFFLSFTMFPVSVFFTKSEKHSALSLWARNPLDFQLINLRSLRCTFAFFNFLAFLCVSVTTLRGQWGATNAALGQRCSFHTGFCSSAGSECVRVIRKSL